MVLSYSEDDTIRANEYSFPILTYYPMYTIKFIEDGIHQKFE